MAAPDASFKMSYDSISFGAMLLISAPTTPSITYSGSLPPDNDTVPRIRTVGLSLGSPLDVLTTTPDALPCNCCNGLVVTPCTKSADDTFTTAPVASFFRTVP